MVKIDRSHVHWDPSKPWDPAEFRRAAGPNDFDLDSLSIEDLLINVHQPGGFRPFPVSIFRADLSAFRKQWLFWDFLHAENVVGQYDGCLFSLHKPQSMGRTNERDIKDSQWSRVVSLHRRIMARYRKLMSSFRAALE
jgi:distribution and morphology protein 31